jgi:hypothetical protein
MRDRPPQWDHQLLSLVMLDEWSATLNPNGSDGKPLWNACIPIYLHIMKQYDSAFGAYRRLRITGNPRDLPVAFPQEACHPSCWEPK